MTGINRKIGEVERQIVSEGEWRSARQDILAKEKALMRAHDELAAERRRQPSPKHPIRRNMSSLSSFARQLI